MVQYKSFEDQEAYSIDYLSDSLIIRNSQLNRMTLNAQAQIQFHNIPRKTRLFFYVRTMYMQSKGSWRIAVDKDGRAVNWLLQYQSMFISLCLAIYCCACLFKILKIICMQLQRIRVGSRSNNSERRSQEDRSNSNFNRSRYFVGQASSSQSNSEVAKLEKERKVKEIIGLLRKKKFGEDKAYDINSCVICMENFREGQQVLEIPICNHCFHHDCCEQWFLSAQQAEEKRCPLCNEVLNKETLTSGQKASINLVSP